MRRDAAQEHEVGDSDRLTRIAPLVSRPQHSTAVSRATGTLQSPANGPAVCLGFGHAWPVLESAVTGPSVRRGVTLAAGRLLSQQSGGRAACVVCDIMRGCACKS